MSEHFRRAKVRFTRRRVITAAATVGVGAAAASVAGLSLAGQSGGPPPAGAQLVVRLRDAKSGTLDIFSGTSRVVVRDRDLAARLTRAAGHR